MKGTPTTAKGRDSVGRVVDAACVLFARQGIRATTLDQVGALSGTGRGQLYLWFSGKPDLVTDVIAHQFARVLDAQQPLLGSMSTAADVREWCERAAAQYAADDPVRCPVGSLVHELAEPAERVTVDQAVAEAVARVGPAGRPAAEPDTSARDALAAGFAQWRGLLAAGMRRVAHHGELAPDITPDDAAAAVLAAYQGGVLLSAATGDLSALRPAMRSVAAGVLRAAA